MNKTNMTTTATVLEVYDPAMCCSTGVCGTDVDDMLVDFANDTKWLKTRGVEVRRFNLGQEPEAFKMNPEVLSRLQKDGSGILPLILVDGKIVAEGGYPGRKQLIEWTGIADRPQPETVSAGAARRDAILLQLEHAVTSGEEDGMQTAFRQGEQLGIDRQALVQAIQSGIDRRQGVTQQMVAVANQLLGVSQSCCSPGSGCC